MTTITTDRAQTNSRLRMIALGAVAGPVLFTLGWLVLGFVSTGYTLFGHTFTEYSPISQPISGLGMGRTAPYMNTVFVVTGAMLAAGAVAAMRLIARAAPGRHRRSWIWATALLTCTGIGQAVDGLFTLEHGAMHGLGFLLAVGTPVAGFWVASRYLRDMPGWARFAGRLRFASPVTLVLVAAFFSQFSPTADGAEHGAAGLIQRIAVLQVHAWFVVLAWRARRAHLA